MSTLDTCIGVEMCEELFTPNAYVYGPRPIEEALILLCQTAH